MKDDYLVLDRLWWYNQTDEMINYMMTEIYIKHLYKVHINISI